MDGICRGTRAGLAVEMDGETMTAELFSGVLGEVILLPGERLFPEGVTCTSDGTFFASSMEEGCIVRAAPGERQAQYWIPPGSGGLVSVLGLWADEPRNLLWACSSDAGNGKLTGTAPVGVRVFDLRTGQPRAGYDFPGGGFANDLTIDLQGNMYVTDSWSPRILWLKAGGDRLSEWINDPQLGVEMWGLNGIDYDREHHVIYVLNQIKDELWRIPIRADGGPGSPVQIRTSLELRRPDGLKVIGADTLATSEAGAGGIAVIQVYGDEAEVRRIPAGLDLVTTFAYFKGSAWTVEGQAQHFWEPQKFGRDAKPPFRIVEVRL
jgi:sugar lactone lactonase YvrE